jgi:perosamine synthetase
MDGIAAVCKEFGLPIVEDATEALGSLYRGRPCGGLGTIGTLSFNGNKILTTGGGGALVFQDLELARKAKHLTTTAKLPHEWSFNHDEIGWNYRLPNLNAALGLGQLKSLDTFVEAKRALAGRYSDAIKAVSGASFALEPENCRSNYWLNAILLDDDSGQSRDEILAATNSKGIMTRPAWTLMHELRMYRDCPRGEMGVSESLSRRIVNVPSGPRLALQSASGRRS